jgi:hypothetical protein
LLWDPTVDSCTSLNCGSVLVGGSVINHSGVSTSRWDVAIYAGAGECLRLDQTTVFGSGVDDEMVVVSPDGTVYRNDDFGSLRPRVVIRPTPTRGWYYVSIARYTGAPAPEHDFYFRFGRYANSSTNPNCASPTAGQLEPASAAAKVPTLTQPAPAGAPSAP